MGEEMSKEFDDGVILLTKGSTFNLLVCGTDRSFAPRVWQSPVHEMVFRLTA